MKDYQVIVGKEIENKKQRMIKEYDSVIWEISEEDNVANLYYLLSKYFKSSRDDIQLEILQDVLTNQFFKGATINNHVNYIYFYNDEFQIGFSKFLSKEIEIKFKNPLYKDSVYGKSNENSVKLGELLEEYLNNKSFKNFKALADFNCRRRKQGGIIRTLFKYIHTYRYCNQELLNEIKEKQRNYKLRVKQVEEHNEKYKEQQGYAKNFVNELKNNDLKIFLDSGWWIKLKGIEDKNGIMNY